MTFHFMMLLKMNLTKWSITLFFLITSFHSNVYSVPDTPSKTVMRFQKEMAKRGNVEAQFKLGLMYESGIGVKPNLFMANRWYKKAALQQHKPAINRLTYLKIKKSGFKIEHTQWIKDVKRDALFHQGEALFLLGQMYSEGTGVEKSLTRALSLMHEANAKDIPGSNSQIIQLERELNTLQKQFISAKEKAKTKHYSLVENQKAMERNRKKSIKKIAPSNIIKTEKIKQLNAVKETKIIKTKPEILPIKIVSTAPVKKDKRGLVIEISKPIIITQNQPIHPMDLICGGQNRFRRQCR